MNLMENQSEQMSTQVETFFQEEVTELIHDSEKLNEWKKINEELGIVGQQQLASPEKSPIPFMHMKQNLVNVFSTLCPIEVDFKEFRTTPIPLEILKLIKLSVKENYFSEIVVRWDDKSPDPVVIGKVVKYGEWNNYSFNSPEEATAALGKEISKWNNETVRYLIGKWGDVKHSLDKLSEMAKARYMKQERTSIEERIRDNERQLEDLINNADKKFGI